MASAGWLQDSQVINVGSMVYGTDQALLAAERQVARLDVTLLTRNSGPSGTPEAA